MSEMSLGSGWWQASDGMWYDPCLPPPAYVPVESADGTRNVVDAIEFIAGTPRVQTAPAGLRAGSAPDHEQGERVPFTGPGRPSVSFGWLAMALMGFVSLMAAALFILLIGVVVGGFLLALLIAVTALGVHRLWLLTGGRYQARRASLTPLQPVPEMIDAAASTADRIGPLGVADGWIDFNGPG